MDPALALDRYDVAKVLAGGLLDGINPCAFTTLVFLCSFLAYAGYGRREVAVIGGLYTLGTFVAYFALSVGTAEVLVRLGSYRLFHLLFSGAVVPFTVFVAVLSFRDAWILTRTGSGRGTALQLPDAVKGRIHTLIRERLRGGRLGAGAFILGAFIALFEYACSGQVLVPTLATVVLKADPVSGGMALKARALAYLVLYNLAFIAPMLAVFGVTLAGVASERLARLARAHLPTARVLLGILFLWFAVVLALLFVEAWNA